MPGLLLMGWLFGGWQGLELALAVLLRPFLLVLLYFFARICVQRIARWNMPPKLRAFLFFRI